MWSQASASGPIGPEHVLCLRLPERDIGGSSSDLGLELANSLGARTEEESITDALEALGCYRRRDEAIRRVFPDYEPSVAAQAGSLAAVGRDDRLLARRRSALTERRSASGCPPRRTGS